MKRDDDFGSMEMSKELADRVAAMPEVRSANVIMVGRSAYVAVMLENASGGVHTRSTTRGKIQEEELLRVFPG